MTPDAYYDISLICGGIIMLLSAWDYVRIKDNNGRRKIRKTGVALIFLALITSLSNIKQRNIEKNERASADSLSERRYDTLALSMNIIRHGDSLLIAKADSQLKLCGFQIQGDKITPLIDVSTNVTSNYQKGGQTAGSIINNR